MQSCWSSNMPMFKFQTVKKGAKLTFISVMCSRRPFILGIYIYGWILIKLSQENICNLRSKSAFLSLSVLKMSLVIELT